MQCDSIQLLFIPRWHIGQCLSGSFGCNIKSSSINNSAYYSSVSLESERNLTILYVKFKCSLQIESFYESRFMQRQSVANARKFNSFSSHSNSHFRMLTHFILDYVRCIQNDNLSFKMAINFVCLRCKLGILPICFAAIGMF